MKNFILGFIGAGPLLSALFQRPPGFSRPQALAHVPGQEDGPQAGQQVGQKAGASRHCALAGLLEHLRPGDVLLDLEVADRTQLFAAIGRYLAEADGLREDSVTVALQRREQIGSTALGQGVAIPCARIRESATVHVLYVRLRQPIEFAAPDGRPVSQALVLLVPKQATEAHLRLLGEATQVFADQRLRERLRLCSDAGEIIDALAQWRPPSRLSPPVGS